MIQWKYLQMEIRREYGKFRLQNELKYQWNRRKLILRQRSAEFLPPLHEDDEI